MTVLTSAGRRWILNKVRVWDLPTRLFHWGLVVCVVGLVVTGEVGDSAMVWHFRLGYGVLSLLLFRLVWGFIGGHWSRERSRSPCWWCYTSLPSSFTESVTRIIWCAPWSRGTRSCRNRLKAPAMMRGLVALRWRCWASAQDWLQDYCNGQIEGIHVQHI